MNPDQKNIITIHNIPVCGLSVGPQTGCTHYHSPLDIIAIKMHCCGTWYACRDCHDALADHPAQTIPQTDFDQPAILCGHCGAQLTVHQYFSCQNRCPQCQANFNPACQNHYHLYFETHNPPTK